MSQEDNILELLEQYFSTADKHQIQSDVTFINGLGKSGVSFEDYLKNLDAIAAIPLAETGICDDIAYSDLYNDLIAAIEMGDLNLVKVDSSKQIAENGSYSAGESLYAMAA